MVLCPQVEMRRLSYFMNIVTEQMDRNEENGNKNRDTFRELTREYSILEIEAAQWMAIYGSRQREKDDIKAGIFLMYELRRQRLKERDTIRRELDVARRDLPSCVVRRASLPHRAPSLCGPVLVLIPHRVSTRHYTAAGAVEGHPRRRPRGGGAQHSRRARLLRRAPQCKAPN